jgi:hypothetical protein
MEASARLHASQKSNTFFEGIIMNLIKAFLLSALSALSTPAFAQEDSLDDVVVTGSRISYQDLQETPAIGILKPADSIVQGFSMECDTREENKRRSEMHKTLKTLLDTADGRFTLETNAGIKLDVNNYQVDFASGSKADSSRLFLRLRASLLNRATKANDLVKSMREFLESSEKTGRTELGLDQLTSLNISRPERFRYELLGAIAADVAKLRTSFGPDCKVSLKNLSARIQWERVSTGELFLFIPYSMQLSECAVAAVQP